MCVGCNEDEGMKKGEKESDRSVSHVLINILFSSFYSNIGD